MNDKLELIVLGVIVVAGIVAGVITKNTDYALIGIGGAALLKLLS